jgi:hypothetical protein
MAGLIAAAATLVEPTALSYGRGMALTIEDILNRKRSADQVYNPLEAEIAAEKASSLGYHGRKVEQAIAALKSFDAATGSADERRALLSEAAREVWAFFVQREACGMRNHRDAIQIYGIPQEVLLRLGAVEPRRR